jgi:hypothetical protein
MNRVSQRYFYCVFGALTALLPALLSAQTVLPTETTESKADAAYTGHNWSLAERAYSSLTNQEPSNARYWYRLGVSERANKHYLPALESFGKARTFGAGKGLPAFMLDYEIACTYAAIGNSTEAFGALTKAADGGFSLSSRLESDSEWNTFRKYPQFSAIAKQVSHNAAPCEDAEFRQLDFWVGDWDVTSASAGVLQGTSHISKEMDGCVIWENWTSAGSSYFGKSYNTYDVNLRRWEQYWVDNSAGSIFFSGTLNGTVMDFWTDDIPQPNGKTLRRHLQFFNLSPVKVRQFSQGSTDGGKTWYVEYDFIYNRHGAKDPGPL